MRPFPDPFDECGCEGHGRYCDMCRAKLAANDRSDALAMLAREEAATARHMAEVREVDAIYRRQGIRMGVLLLLESAILGLAYWVLLP